MECSVQHLTIFVAPCLNLVETNKHIFTLCCLCTIFSWVYVKIFLICLIYVTHGIPNFLVSELFNSVTMQHDKVIITHCKYELNYCNYSKNEWFIYIFYYLSPWLNTVQFFFFYFLSLHRETHTQTLCPCTSHWQILQGTDNMCLVQIRAALSVSQRVLPFKHSSFTNTTSISIKYPFHFHSLPTGQEGGGAD